MRGRLRTPFLLVVGALLALVTAAAAGSTGGQRALHGHLFTRTLWSAALARRERMLVYVPPGYLGGRRTYPLAILLHGVPGRPEDFVDHGSVSEIDSQMAAGRVAPFVVAFPQGGDRPTDDNEWADSTRRPDERWESYLGSDVLGYVQSRFRVRSDARGHGIAGLSMGGFGAMNVALHHRDRFGAVSSWSGYFNANTPSVDPPLSPEARAHSPQAYARDLSPSLAAWHPAIDFYVGDRDRFAAENTAFNRLLTGLHVPHSFRVVHGAGHDWGLWASQLDHELAFLAGSFAGAPGGGQAAPG
ncbi:MAG: esterase family protein [Actinomycetota bacterium]|nr:esterase family protein [Actinomycetota bacterium]